MDDVEGLSSSKKVTRIEEKESEDIVLLASDAEEMVKQLKEKFQKSKTRSDRMKALTVLPKSWSTRKVATLLNVSRNTARHAKKLVADILCSPNPPPPRDPVLSLSKLKKK